MSERFFSYEYSNLGYDYKADVEGPNPDQEEVPRNGTSITEAVGRVGLSVGIGVSPVGAVMGSVNDAALEAYNNAQKNGLVVEQVGGGEGQPTIDVSTLGTNTEKSSETRPDTKKSGDIYVAPKSPDVNQDEDDQTEDDQIDENDDGGVAVAEANSNPDLAPEMAPNFMSSTEVNIDLARFSELPYTKIIINSNRGPDEKTIDEAMSVTINHAVVKRIDTYNDGKSETGTEYVSKVFTLLINTPGGVRELKFKSNDIYKKGLNFKPISDRPHVTDGSVLSFTYEILPTNIDGQRVLDDFCGAMTGPISKEDCNYVLGNLKNKGIDSEDLNFNLSDLTENAVYPLTVIRMNYPSVAR